MTIEARRTIATRMLAVAFVCIVAPVAGCSARTVDPETLPDEYRQPYAVFSARCSRCHGLARPLNAPVRDATHWELYVARMRRQPGSGINEADAREILRFLVYYTEVVRGHAESSGTEPLPLEEGESIDEASSDEVSAPASEPTTYEAPQEPAPLEEAPDVAPQ